MQFRTMVPRALFCFVVCVASTFVATDLRATTSATKDNSAAGANYFTVAPGISAPGQFIEFSWNVNAATGFAVTPNLIEEEQTQLPASASNYARVAPTSSTTYVGTAIGGGQPGKPLTAPLTIVPITLTASANNINAGRQVQLSFTGPNNGSSFFLITLPENSSTPLAPDSCSGAVCRGTYLTPQLGSNKIFMVGANGPYNGQAYSPAKAVNVSGGMSLTCTATPITPSSGGAVSISWTSINASSVSIDQGVGIVSPTRSGQVVVHPTRTTNYTCTAADRFGDTLAASTKAILSTGDVQNLNHIVFMMQENRAFDNYFGNLAYYRVYVDNLPGAQMSDVNDLHNLPTGYTLQNPQGQSIPPFHQRTECIEGLNPQWDQSHYDMDLVGNNWLNLTSSSQFLMDDFLLSAGTGQYDPSESRPLGYYDWTDLPFYYELATQFDTSDTFYSPAPDATEINRAYLFAATSYGDIFDPASNNWLWQRPTIFRVLQDAGITWRYYYQDDSVYLAKWADWNNPQIQNNVRNIQEWYNILSSSGADSQLPQVVFIERASATGYDEHPGNNVQTGAARVQQILNALLTSQAWPDSAFLLTYDEGGGTYEQQPPILVTPPDDKVPLPYQQEPYVHGLFNVTGFRVPFVVVSPWSKAHFVFHQQGDYTSILKLIETRYSLSPMTHRDGTATDLTDPTNGPFDFNTPEMLTVPALPTQPTNGTCNYQLESYPGQ